MTTLDRILEAALTLPLAEQEALMQAMKKHQSEIRRTELAEYARQMELEVQAGRLRPKSVAEIMKLADEPWEE